MTSKNPCGVSLSRARRGGRGCILWLGFGCFLLLRQPALAQAGSPGPDLIQIGVEVVEVDEQKAQTLGISWISNLTIQEVAVPSVLKIGTLTRDPFFADIQALLTEGAANLLANPKLVTRDGTTATFHAGGELPYIVSGSLGTVTVEFKPYGVNLKVDPHVDDKGRIVMGVSAEVSEPDDQNAVTFQGTTVPGIRSRTVSSQLTMEPGSTLTMAGLLQNEKQWVRSGVPGLMHIPLLGKLFSYKTEKNERTSIVVFITPTVLTADSPSVAPAAGGFLRGAGISSLKPTESPTGLLGEDSDSEPSIPVRKTVKDSEDEVHG